MANLLACRVLFATPTPIMVLVMLTAPLMACVGEGTITVLSLLQLHILNPELIIIPKATTRSL